MLKLGGVASLHVAKWRIRIDDSLVAQVLERHQVLGLIQAVQPASAESERSEVLVDHVQKLL